MRGICFLDACKCMWNDIDIVYIQYNIYDAILGTSTHCRGAYCSRQSCDCASGYSGLACVVPRSSYPSYSAAPLCSCRQPVEYPLNVHAQGIYSLSTHLRWLRCIQIAEWNLFICRAIAQSSLRRQRLGRRCIGRIVAAADVVVAGAAAAGHAQRCGLWHVLVLGLGLWLRCTPSSSVDDLIVVDAEELGLGVTESSSHGGNAVAGLVQIGIRGL